MAGAAAPVMLLPLRLAALMGREKSNTTQISVDSSALGQQPVLMSSIFVTVTRHTDILSPALLDRLQPLAITIVRRRASRVCAVSLTRELQVSGCSMPSAPASFEQVTLPAVASFKRKL
jgi:hypothetical protein